MQLQQVVLNLIVNAVQAMGGVADGPRELFITTARVEPDGVLVAVKDSGPVVAPASLERLFAPFSILSLMVWAWGCRSAVRSSNSGRPVVGDRQPAPWRHLQLHGVHPPGRRIVTTYHHCRLPTARVRGQ